MNYGKKWKISVVIITFLVVITGAVVLSLYYKYEEKTPPLKQQLTLADYPDSFKQDVIIVIGENASSIETKGAHEIAQSLYDFTHTIPVIKTDVEITDDKLAGFNLILMGCPDTNMILDELHNMTDTIRVTYDYPGAEKGVLEILYNPWDEEKVVLLVEGSDEEGIRAGINELYWLQLSKQRTEKSQGDNITIEGTIHDVISQSFLSFDECILDSPSIITNEKTYYLENICPYIYLFSGNLTDSRIIVSSKSDFIIPGKTVEVTGKIVTKNVEVPISKEQNPPTEIKTYEVIVVSDLKLLNRSTNTR